MKDTLGVYSNKVDVWVLNSNSKVCKHKSSKWRQGVERTPVKSVNWHVN